MPEAASGIRSTLHANCMRGNGKVEGGFLGFSPIPQERYESIYEIDGKSLRERGVRLLLMDLDNTISPYGCNEPARNLAEWVAELRGAGVEPFILSNSRKPTRVQEFAGKLGVPFHRRAGKPKRGGFLAAMQEMGCSRRETAMVGDQIFTDILGANRAGVYSFLVRPLRFDTIFRVLRYGIETPFRLLAKAGKSRKEVTNGG